MVMFDLGVYIFFYFWYIVFFVFYGCVFFVCLFMVSVEKYRLLVYVFWVLVLIVNLYGVCVFFIDCVLNVNYFYLMKKLKIVLFLNVFGFWLWYFFLMEVVVILSFFILYILFWLLKKRV